MNFDFFVDMMYDYFMIPRFYDPLDPHLQPGRALILYGPRRAGKTTLLKSFLSQTKLKYRLESGDNVRVREILGGGDFDAIRDFVEGYELLAIDEAQEIPGIGQGLKIVVDEHPHIHVITTGSSSFELAHQVGEPLTGRKRTLVLYPLAQTELALVWNKHDLKDKLEDFLIYGSYPDVVMARGHKEKAAVLRELADSYLLKDVLAHERIRSPRVLIQLLKLIAFQVGSEVSLNELATQTSVDVKTIGRYLDLLEKAFVITGLGAFSRNPRREITTKKKYYFLDTGIRNAVISQFNPLSLRNDTGQLWENFVIMERAKRRAYQGIQTNPYFWRSYSGEEIDLIEEHGQNLDAREIKWSTNHRPRPPADWTERYPNQSYSIITPANYLEFVG